MTKRILKSMLDLCPDVQDYLVSDIDPALVSGTNRERYKFKCKMCGDIFERAAGDYTEGIGLCSTCTKIHNARSCAKTRAADNSLLGWFIEHRLDIPEVVSNQDLSTVARGSSRVKIRFRCKLGHEFEQTPYLVSKGYWCPLCARSKRISKPALCLYMFIMKYRDCVLEYTIPDSRLSLDIYIENMHLGIEFDGQRYHKKAVRDTDKDKTCSERGITVLNIREPECPTIEGDNVYTLSKPVSSWQELDECRVWLNQKLKIRPLEFSFENSWFDMYTYLYNGKVPNNAYDAIAACKDNDRLISARSRAESLGRNEKTIKLEFECLKCGYQYNVTPMNYIRHHSRCPVCAGRLVHETNNLVNSDIADQYSALNISDISSIHIRASKKCIWRCHNGHYYEASPECRNSGTETGCPICCNNLTLKGFNDLETWYPVMFRMIREEVGTLANNSKRKLHFKCEVCGHIFVSSPINMHKRRHYCPNWRTHDVDEIYIEQIRAYE